MIDLPPSPEAAPQATYILLVEDNPGDARLAATLLEEAPCLPPTLWVQSLAAALRRLDHSPGCLAVLLDLNLPDCSGLEALHALLRHNDRVAVVVLTGEDSEPLGLQAVVAGAQDFLLKGNLEPALLRRCIHFATQRKLAEQALIKRVLHDELTQLPRRTLLMDRLNSALTACTRGALRPGLLFIDLDHFKRVNDNLGHAAGDELLCRVAARLAGCVRASDTVARIGGDEFAVLLPGMGEAMQALAVGHKLLEAASTPVELAGRQLAPSLSVGVVMALEGETATQLLARADMAMYAAKRAGRGRVTLL